MGQDEVRPVDIRRASVQPTDLPRVEQLCLQPHRGHRAERQGLLRYDQVVDMCLYPGLVGEGTDYAEKGKPPCVKSPEPVVAPAACRYPRECDECAHQGSVDQRLPPWRSLQYEHYRDQYHDERGEYAKKPREGRPPLS